MNQAGSSHLSQDTGSTQNQIPEAARGLCWGGFFLNWIWAIGNHTLIGLLALVPVIGIVMPFVLLFKGREWAWKNKKWKSVEHFNSVQRKWSIFGLIFTILIPILGIVTAIFIPNYVRYQAKAQQSEAKIALMTVYASEKAYMVEYGAFNPDLAAVGIDPKSFGRYQIGFAQSGPEFAKNCADCVASGTSFKAVAFGNIGSEGRLDVWTIDQDGKLVNVVDGTKSGNGSP